MSQAKKAALNAVRKYFFKGFTKSEIIRVLCECGYIVLEEGVDENRFEAVLCAIDMQDMFVTRCFSYACEKARFVFVPQNVSENEKAYLLAEQLAYVLFGDFNNGTTLDLTFKQKQRAKSFAVHLEEICGEKGIRGFFVKYRLEAVTISILVAATVSVFSFLAVYEALLDNRNKNMLQYAKESENAVLQTGNQQESEDENADDSENVKLNLSEAVVYYVTANGEKYHIKGCTYIKNLETCVSYSKEEIVNTDFEPCKRCVGKEA